MENKPESNRKTKSEHWTYLFEIIVVNDDFEDYLHRYYVNSEINKIKEEDYTYNEYDTIIMPGSIRRYHMQLS